MYNVPFDSDIYAVPIDMVRPSHSNTRGKPKKPSRPNKRRGKSTPQNIGSNFTPVERSHRPKDSSRPKDSKTKRHSLPSSSAKKNTTDSDTDSLHLTLREMRKYLHTLYSSSSDSECRNTIHKKSNTIITNVGIHMRHTTNKESATTVFLKETNEIPRPVEANNNHRNTNKNSASTTTKVKKHKENAPKEAPEVEKPEKVTKKTSNAKTKMSPVRMLSMNLKQSFCNLFRWRRSGSEEASSTSRPAPASSRTVTSSPPAAVRRALPPLPQSPQSSHTTHLDFATSIQKVKDYPWYWGPISVEAAEKILSNEPDGSFIVRDSSDDHYIFTLTFKLNGLRHVRIEHDQGAKKYISRYSTSHDIRFDFALRVQENSLPDVPAQAPGNFCFGGCTMFKAQTIVEFIENAVETSRSGRYLFFLNLRPVLGPVRVQLLYPVSRFKRVQSLQHTCRFVILKYVRRDLISSLPLPRRLLDYLSATHYYSELLAEM
ncbi:Suppressor of cytokine signaling 7 [Papilio xuthus]|uniref:Suppressor of cytokine signaling 7 n=1 Tax=Papilio xuthus TaxID=66420 RepID=A0A194PTQ2_PAPXU|nr:Suppressor of cytokine signaling 7 [Papilio xuthus]